MIAYALLLGLVAALNPCGAPLLPAYLALFCGRMDAGVAPTASRRALLAASAGLVLTAAFVVVFALAGIPIVLAHVLVTAIGPATSAIGGLVMIAIGALALRGRVLHIPVAARLSGGRRVRDVALFGVVWAIGSLGCELPLFVSAIAIGRPDGGMPVTAQVLGFAVGMGLAVTALSLIVALAGAGVAARMRGAVGVARFVGPVVAIVAGAWIVLVEATTMLVPSAAAGMIAPLESLQAEIAAAAGHHILLVCATLVAICVACALTAAIVGRYRHRTRGLADV